MADEKLNSAKESTRTKFPRRCQQNLPASDTADQSSESFHQESIAWSRNAKALASFAAMDLVNRRDVYGQYQPEGQGKVRTVHAQVTEELLRQHFSATDRSELIGLHTTSKNNTCRWLVIDIDHHGEPDPEIESRNEKAAIAFAKWLSDFGAMPLVMKSNGRGCFHIWVIFDEPVSSERVYALGRAAVKSWEEFQITKPEVFPKQPRLKEGQFGNFVRLPGRHHTQPFYTQVLRGKTWLKGEEAIDRIIVNPPCPSELVENSNFPIEEEVNNLTPDLTTADDNDLAPIERVLKRLRGVKRCGNGWVARCPAHIDSNPSLAVSQAEDGKVLLYCHAQCSFEQIVEALKLQPQDLFPKRGYALRADFLPEYLEEVNEDSATRTSMEQLHREALEATSQDKIEALAESLGVTPKCLNDLQVAWSEKDQCWLFPERNGKKQIIGLLRRYPDGEKFAVPGGQRGLYIPDSFDMDQDRIWIAEGASDTAAALCVGLNVIGRPSAGGGAQQLIDLLKDYRGTIHVLADNDSKRDGSWPGKQGAESVAKLIQASLNTQVKLNFPPKEYKDLRSAVLNCGVKP